MPTKTVTESASGGYSAAKRRVLNKNPGYRVVSTPSDRRAVYIFNLIKEKTKRKAPKR